VVGWGAARCFSIILWLAKHVDLIFVFMDPVGQALCTRTMNVVKALDVCSCFVAVLAPCSHLKGAGLCSCIAHVSMPLFHGFFLCTTQQARYGGKMKFFITKADQVPRALDLQSIITQTVAVRVHVFEGRWLPRHLDT